MVAGSSVVRLCAGPYRLFAEASRSAAAIGVSPLSDRPLKKCRCCGISDWMSVSKRLDEVVLSGAGAGQGSKVEERESKTRVCPGCWRQILTRNPCSRGLGKRLSEKRSGVDSKPSAQGFARRRFFRRHC